MEFVQVENSASDYYNIPSSSPTSASLLSPPNPAPYSSSNYTIGHKNATNIYSTTSSTTNTNSQHHNQQTQHAPPQPAQHQQQQQAYGPGPTHRMNPGLSYFDSIYFIVVTMSTVYKII